MPEHFTDAELVARALKNPDSYGLIIERFEAPLTRYIIRITRAEHEEVEDILQSVFIKAYRSLNGFDTGLKLSSWMYRIAHNACVDFLRKHTRRQHASLDADDEYSQSLLEVIASEENVALHLTRDEQRRALKKLIRSLPEKYRTVIILFFGEDKSYEEISDILQIPI